MNVGKFRSCLKKLGISDLSVFANRKKLHNIAYLLQEVFRIDLGLPPFRWYMHGIYNPQIRVTCVKTERE